MTQAQDQFFEKGLENWDFYVVKKRPIKSRDRARNSKKGPSSTQARDRFLEKGLENWDFYVVKNTGSSRLGIELL